MKYIDVILYENSLSNANLIKKYNYYNSLLFNNELPKIPITYAKMKHAGGKVEYGILRITPQAKKPDRGDKFYGCILVPNSLRMKISDTQIRSEQELNGIIIHEMIHVYFASRNEFGIGHGYKFINMAKKIENIVGFDIPLKDEIDVDNMTLNDQRNFKPVYVIIKNVGSHYNFGIFNISFVEKNFFEISRILEKTIDLKYAKGVLAGITDSEYWNKLAAILPLQRTYSRTTKWYKLPTEHRDIAVSSLKNGKVELKIGDI